MFAEDDGPENFAANSFHYLTPSTNTGATAIAEATEAVKNIPVAQVENIGPPMIQIVQGVSIQQQQTDNPNKPVEFTINYI
jgi:uncharacterized heparinase superfamily protein